MRFSAAASSTLTLACESVERTWRLNACKAGDGGGLRVPWIAVRSSCTRR